MKKIKDRLRENPNFTKGKFIRSFEKYLQKTDEFNDLEKNKINHSLEDPRTRKITKLSLILIMWALFGVLMDKIIVGGSILAAFMQESIDYTIVIPFFAFMTLNIIIKYIFIIHYNYRHSLCLASLTKIKGTIPYFGSLLIFGNTLQNSKIFIQALRKFVKHKRKKFFR